MQILDYNPNSINLDVSIKLHKYSDVIDISIPYNKFFTWAKVAEIIDVHCPSSKEVVIIDKDSGYFCHSRQEWVNTFEGRTYSYNDWAREFLSDNEDCLKSYLTENKNLNKVGFQHPEAA